MRVRSPDERQPTGENQCRHARHAGATLREYQPSSIQDLLSGDPRLTGKGYIGKSGMLRSTLANVIRVLWPNTSGGFSDSFFLESHQDADSLNLSEYYIDMDVAGEGLLVTYWTE
jgi:hypothetical protein